MGKQQQVYPNQHPYTTLAPIIMNRGYYNNGSWIRNAEFRQMIGYDEQFLFDLENYSNGPIPNFIKSIALLERIVTFEMIDEDDGNKKMKTTTISPSPTNITSTTIIPNTGTILRNITIGDRNLLLLSLRKLLIGDKIQCFVTCPRCKKDMSFDISTDFLCKMEKSDPQIDYAVDIGDFRLRIQPIVGIHEEAMIMKMTKQDTPSLSSITEDIMRNCITSSSRLIPADVLLSDEFIGAIGSKLLEIDPLSEITLDLVCPECQYPFKSPFVADEFIFQELSSRYGQFESEVHWLALNYHWSEDAILSLPLRKRKRYVDLINKSLYINQGDV